MKRRILIIIFFVSCIYNVFANGFYESHKQKGRWTVHVKTYWQNQLPFATDDMVKKWHDNALNQYINNLPNGKLLIEGFNTNTRYITNVILQDGMCYEIVAGIYNYYGGCNGDVCVYKFNIATSGEIIPEMIWSKEFLATNGTDYFNDTYQLYQKKVNEYLKMIK